MESALHEPGGPARQDPAQRTGFEQSVQAQLPDLYRCARALTGGQADAEDLVHDACVKALTSAGAADLPDEGARRAWVRQILVNTFRDRYRRERRAPVQAVSSTRGADDGQDDANVIELAASPDPSPGDWAQYSQFEVAARAAMSALPPEVRVVTTLHIVSGVSYKEIAHIAQCPLGTVMSRLARGRRLLRVALGRFVESVESLKEQDANQIRSRP